MFDIMILEHLLYHTINAHFVPLRHLFEKNAATPPDPATLATKRQDAERLLYAFDCEYHS